jgi:hypothetical protein
VRLKGDQPSLKVLVSRHGEPARPLPQEAGLHAGDLLKLVVTLPSDGFVFIANLDERGHFTRYFPVADARSAPLRSGEHVLPGTIQLDDFVGDELLVVIFSEASLREDEVEAALGRAYAHERGDLKAIHGVELPATRIATLPCKKVP